MAPRYAARILPFTAALAGILIAHADFVAWNSSVNLDVASWGRMLHLQNGNWLAVETIYPGGSNYLKISVSADTYRTWTQVSTLTESGRNLDNGELIQLASGTILITMRSILSSGGLNYSYSST